MKKFKISTAVRALTLSLGAGVVKAESSVSTLENFSGYTSNYCQLEMIDDKHQYSRECIENLVDWLEENQMINSTVSEEVLEIASHGSSVKPGELF